MEGIVDSASSGALESDRPIERLHVDLQSHAVYVHACL